MRFHEKVLVGIVLGMILVIIGFSNSDKIPLDPVGSMLSPNPENFRTVANLYFVEQDILKVEKRDVEYDDSGMASVIMGELMKGPRNLNFEGPFESGNSILSVEMKGKRLTVDIDPSFLENRFWDHKRSELYIWSIVNSLTELEGVYEVQLLADGKAIDRRVNTYDLSMPLPRIEEYVYKSKKYPSEVVIKFIDSLYAGRFDISYDLLSLQSREKMDFEKFTNVYSDYAKRNEKYSKDLYLMQDFDDYYIVTVRYSNPETMSEHFYEKWKLVFEGSELRIDIEYEDESENQGR